MSERITDERLAKIRHNVSEFNLIELYSCLRELQQRRAAERYATRWHIGDCAANQSHAEPGESVPCTCGYDQLPEYLRGGR